MPNQLGALQGSFFSKQPSVSMPTPTPANCSLAATALCHQQHPHAKMRAAAIHDTTTMAGMQQLIQKIGRLQGDRCTRVAQQRAATRGRRSGRAGAAQQSSRIASLRQFTDMEREAHASNQAAPLSQGAVARRTALTVHAAPSTQGAQLGMSFCAKPSCNPGWRSSTASSTV